MLRRGQFPLSAPSNESRRSEAEATFEALACTLPIATLEVSPGQTLRRGTLAAPRRSALPATRDGAARELGAGGTLPRMEVARSGDDGRADLELVRALGEGGMGVVWLARQRSLAREVAVKRLKREGAAAAGAAALLAEARATGALEHPGVVPVHALGADANGSPMLVMKRIEGESFEALLRDPEHPAWPRLWRRYGDRTNAVVEILMRVADALELAHARGIVHRDVKPENVMVGGFGEVYLVDWGTALRPGELDEEDRTNLGIVGTPSFMAPEMVRGDASAIDARTDVYLLGATLHAAITGRPRHAGGSLASVLLSALVSAPEPYEGELSELGALANKATSPDKAERPPSAAAFRDALADFLRHRSSLRLAREAVGWLDGLGGEPTAAALATPEATRVLTECRFALVQALREWNGNEDARRGLDRTLRLAIEAELFRRSPDAGEALLAELASPDAALVSRIAALRAELSEARRLEEQARAEERERDPRRTARQRAWIMAGLIVLAVVLVAMGWRSEAAQAGKRSMNEVLGYDAVLALVTVALIGVFRGPLLANRVGRQTAAVMVAMVIAEAISDGIFWVRSGDPRDAGAFSLLVMAGVLTGAGIGIDWRFLVPAGAFLTGGIVCGLAPALTIPAIGGAAIVAMATVLVDALVQLRR